MDPIATTCNAHWFASGKCSIVAVHLGLEQTLSLEPKQDTRRLDETISGEKYRPSVGDLLRCLAANRRSGFEARPPLDAEAAVVR